ncbi:hypothetical protein PYCC9005_005417 [Savitreella phatthalungensis]
MDTPPSGVSDSDWRRYAAALEKVLALWEAVETWPDNISFLGKLHKCVAAHPTINTLPHASTVAGCLSLCLLPDLPAGVHAKALELYAYIFGLLGRDGLTREQDLWLPGIAPVLGHASIAVRASTITLLSTFFVPLGIRLRTTARALLLTVMPALEDEHDDLFDGALKLTDEIRGAFADDVLWWSTVWLTAVRTNSPGRLSTLNYLLRRLTRSDEESLCLPDAGLLVNALASGLRDGDVLVQRGFLEVLVSRLPPSIVPRLSNDHTTALVGAAAEIVLRRDVALNRRLYAWLHGPSEDPEERAKYFDNNFKRALAAAISRGLRLELAGTSRVWLSLLDRDDIGGIIIDDCFNTFVHEVYRQRAADTAVTALFDAMPEGKIFQALYRDVSRGGENALDRVRYVIHTFDLTDEEMAVIHAPRLVLYLATRLQPEYLELALTLVNIIPSHAVDAETTIPENIHDIDDYMNRIYEDQADDGGVTGASTGAGTGIVSAPENEGKATGTTGHIWASYIAQLLHRPDTNDVRQQLWQLLRVRFELAPATQDYIHTLRDILPALAHFEDVQGIVDLAQLSPHHPLVDSSLTQQLIQRCFDNLGSLHLAREVDAVALIANLASAASPSDRRTITDVLTAQVAQELTQPRPIERFAALWTHLEPTLATDILSQALILVIDAFAFGPHSTRSYITRWLLSLTDRRRIYIPLLALLSRDTPGHVDRISLLGLQIDTRRLVKRQTLDATVYAATLLGTVVDRVSPPEDMIGMITTASTDLLKCTYTSSTTEIQLWELFSTALTILQRLSSDYAVTVTIPLVHALVLAVEQHLFTLQHGLLEALSGLVNAQTDKRLLLNVVAEGLAATRTHPVLQDWATFATGLVTHMHASNLTLDLVHCLCEQVDLNLVDLDVVLASSRDNAKDTGIQHSSHENVLILLALLQSVTQSVPQTPNDPPTVSATSSSSLLGAIGLAAERPSTPIPMPKQASTVETLRSIVKLGVRAWAWSSAGKTSANASTRYVAGLILTQTKSLLRAAHNTAPDAVVVHLAQCWSEQSDEAFCTACLSVCRELIMPSSISQAISALCDAIKQLWTSPDRAQTCTPAIAALRYLNALVGRQIPLADVGGALTELTDILRLLSNMPAPTSVSATAYVVAQQLAVILHTTPQVRDSKRARRDINDIMHKLLVPTIAAIHSTNTHADELLLLDQIIPNLQPACLDTDRVAASAAVIMANHIAPSLKAATASSPASDDVIAVLAALTGLEGVQKAWRREAMDHFGLSTFFSSTRLSQARLWMTVIAAWLRTDQDRLNELLTARPSAAAAPAHLFASADSERAWKTQQSRRLCLSILAMPQDTFVDKLDAIIGRVKDLLAGKQTSPLRAEAFLLAQVVVARFSQEHLRGFIPMIVGELRRTLRHLVLKVPADALVDVGNGDRKQATTKSGVFAWPGSNSTSSSQSAGKKDDSGSVMTTTSADNHLISQSLIAAARLVDTLLAISPPEAQLHEWLFLTDTVEAVFPSTTTSLSSRNPSSANLPGIAASDTRPLAPFFIELAQKLPVGFNGETFRSALHAELAIPHADNQEHDYDTEQGELPIGDWIRRLPLLHYEVSYARSSSSSNNHPRNLSTDNLVDDAILHVLFT